MFASDGVSPPGGVPAIGLGRVLDFEVSGSGAHGTEPARMPLTSGNLRSMANFRPLLPYPVPVHPLEPANQKAPGLGTVFGKVVLKALNFLAAPAPTRKSIPSEEERAEYLQAPVLAEPVHRDMVNVDTGTPFSDTADGGMPGPAPVINTPKDGATDDVSEQIQSPLSNEHDYLLTLRAAMPNVAVGQMPSLSRSVVLVQPNGVGNFMGDLNIPDGTVAVRITWTNASQNDLWASFTSQAFIPGVGNQPGVNGGLTQGAVQNDGPMLNPDPTMYYLAKNKRSISFSCQNACIVNVQCYQQA